MTSNTKLYDIMLDHGWSSGLIEELYKASYIHKEFDNGIVFLCKHTDDVDILFAASEGDKHPRDMWRTIRTILKERKKPIITNYTRNYNKLLKASKRYGCLELGLGVVIFT